MTDGWFAAIDPDAGVHNWQWQPCLRLDGDLYRLGTWFQTEEDCLSYIATKIMGQGFADGPASSS